MQKSIAFFCAAASLVFMQCASAQGIPMDLPIEEYTAPATTSVSVSFADSSAVFQPGDIEMEMLAAAKFASMVIVNGRTSTLRPSAKDESLALERAISARDYLIKRGVSPLKIMVNYVSAGDFIADNGTPEGRYRNQRVDIEMIYVPRDLASRRW